MSDRMWRVLAEKIDPEWGPERERAVQAAIARRTDGRRRTVRAGVAAASLILVGTGAFALVRGYSIAPHPSSTVAAGTPAGGVTPAETVVVTLLSPDTVLEPLPEPEGRGFNLRVGSARFVVPHDGQRPFRVTAGRVTIEDLGTMFSVRYVGPDRLDIAVEEGRVRVRAGDSDTEIRAGATLEVPLSPGGNDATDRRPGKAVAASAPAVSWRPLAEHGAYEEAHRALRRAGADAVRDDMADLLLAADTARLSGHPAEAVPYLERVVRGHARDPRAGLAAFTLGRVLLDELGRPREAIDAFAMAHASGGPLAEDALAREVEAASRAGDVSRSRELALSYRRLYPNGRRAMAVSRFGGLD